MFECYEQLFGVRIQEVEGEVDVWKQGVRCYSVSNSEGGKLLGYFYMDIFQDGKQGNGTMMRPLRCRVKNSSEPALAILFCSFPAAVEGQAALLQFADVPTLFHEFGHVMHLMCSETELHSSGSHLCAMDFIEMPSQLLENWAWEPSIIKKFAKHYQTGAEIPDELLAKLIASRYAKSIMDHYLTLQLGMSDLGIHGSEWQQFCGEGGTQRVQALCPCPYPLSDMGEKPNMFLKQGQFVDNAYPGMLYTYSWGRVMAADVFSRFQKEGLLNAKLGKEYRERILEKGASLPASELYRDFMGREPDSEAQLSEMKQPL
ncbi:MAG: M3 family metallopeptidase, partial [Akkermansia sp.]